MRLFLLFALFSLNRTNEIFELIGNHLVYNDNGLLASLTNTNKIKCLIACDTNPECSFVSIIYSSCKLFRSTSWVYLTPSLLNSVFYQKKLPNKHGLSGNKTLSNTTILNNQSGWIYSLNLLSNGYIVSGSYDKSIHIWDPISLTLVQKFTVSSSLYSTIEIPNDVLGVGLSNGKIELWNTRNWTLSRTINAHSTAVSKLECIGNGLVASGSWDFKVKIWNSSDWSLVSTLSNHTDNVWGIVLTNNGFLATSSCDNKTIIWNLFNYTIEKTLTGHNDCIRCLIKINNGDLVSGSLDGTVKIWDSLAFSLKKTIITGYQVRSIAYHSEFKLVIGSRSNPEIEIWDFINGTLEKRLVGHFLSVVSLLVLPYGDLMSGDQNGTIIIWNNQLLH